MNLRNVVNHTHSTVNVSQAVRANFISIAVTGFSSELARRFGVSRLIEFDHWYYRINNILFGLLEPAKSLTGRCLRWSGPHCIRSSVGCADDGERDGKLESELWKVTRRIGNGISHIVSDVLQDARRLGWIERWKIRKTSKVSKTKNSLNFWTKWRVWSKV